MYLAAFRLHLRRFVAAMSTPPSASHSLLSPDELRALTHPQLLDYALKHASSSPPPKRPRPNSCPPPQEGGVPHSDGKVPASEKTSTKTPRIFDMGRYGQRMIALRLNYQGWRFNGFASQPGNQDTVEAHLFAALLRTRLIEAADSCHYSRAGRTDVGVSALAQVVGLRVRSTLAPPSAGKEEVDYVKTINSALPDGMRVMAWSPVCDGCDALPVVYAGDAPHIRAHWERLRYAASRDGGCSADDVHGADVRRPGELFSARFDATFRSYKYFFLRARLDLRAMADAAARFEGRHDFRNFCRIDEGVVSFERLMYAVRICRARDDRVVRRGGAEGDGCDGKEGVVEGNGESDDEFAMYYILVRGQAFLWHQVRSMAAVLFDVGLRRERPTLVSRLLEDARKPDACGRPHYRLASPTPLMLFECAYPDSVVHFGRPPNMLCDGSGSEEVGRDVNILANRTGEYGKRTPFERADGHLAACFAEESAKGAVLHAILRDNQRVADSAYDTDEGGDARGTCPSSESVPKADREKQRTTQQKDHKEGRHVFIPLVRLLLPDAQYSRHVPYERRGRDDPVSKKLKRAAEKRKRKELANSSLSSKGE